MKIILSKTQWEEIGKQANWIKHALYDNDDGLNPTIKKKLEEEKRMTDRKYMDEAERKRKEESKKLQTLKSIFESLPGESNNADRPTKLAKELAFHDAYGEAYLALSFNEERSAIRVEKYYENEFIQDEFGKVKYVMVNWEDPKETISIITNIIKAWTR
jgi:hypothetical protein